MTNFGELFAKLSEALDQVPERKEGERLVIVVGGFAHMSKDMREQLLNGLCSPGVLVMTADQFEAKRTPEARNHADSLRDLDAALRLMPLDMPGVRLDRVRQGKGERKRNKRHRYCSWMP